MNKENCSLKLVHEIILYYDARSKKHQITYRLSHLAIQVPHNPELLLAFSLDIIPWGHLMVLSDSPLCRRCGAEDETSAHILCECEALASLRHVYLGSFFLDPENIESVILGAIWKFSKVTGLPMNWHGAQRACQLRSRCIGTVRAGTQMQISQSV